MKILFIGDIFASPGRRIVASHLQDIIETNGIDLALANAENAASPVEVNATDPLSLWRWFCASAKVIHVGALLEPPDPTKQMDLF